MYVKSGLVVWCQITQNQDPGYLSFHQFMSACNDALKLNPVAYPFLNAYDHGVFVNSELLQYVQTTSIEVNKLLEITIRVSLEVSK